MPVETAVLVLSLVALLVPAVAIVIAVSRQIFADKLVIKDGQGHVLRTITREDIVSADPEELKNFHRELQRRLNGTATPAAS